MTKQNELKKLEEALADGKSFESTTQGRDLDFDSEAIKLYAFNAKQYVTSNLRELKRVLQREEDLYNDINESPLYHQKKLVDFIESQKGESINGKIKTSDIKYSLESYKKTAQEREYNNKHLYIKTILDVMRKKDFNIVDRFNSDIDGLIGNNLEVKNQLTDDLKHYITANKINLVDTLNIEPTSLKESANREINAELNYHYANDEAIDIEIQDKLKKQTKVSLSKEIECFVKKFNFHTISSTYEEFHKMMVSFAIEDVKESMKGEWNSISDFINSKDGELLAHEKNSDHDVDDHCFTSSETATRKIEDDVYTISRNTLKDCEGENIKEEWRKNGEFHRAGNLPAIISKNHHFIPEETHLDRAEKDYWLNGENISTQDTTYEDILSKKSLAERQSIGYDVDEGEGDYMDCSDDYSQTPLSYSQEMHIKDIIAKYKNESPAFDTPISKNSAKLKN